MVCATVTIKDNDAEPTVGIYDAEVEERRDELKAVLRLPVKLAPSGRDVTVTVAATDGTATTADNDYDTPAGTLVIVAGESGGYVDVDVNGDGVDSASAETFTVTLSNPQNAVLDPAHTTATGTIYDEDGDPTLRITGTTVSEGVVGGKASVNVDLFPPHTSPSPVTVDYATGDGSAKAPADYTAIATTTLAFAAGETVKTFDVSIAADAVDELDEALSVSLSNEANAGVGRRSDSVAILDDDGPVVSVSNVSVTEGNTGTKPPASSSRCRRRARRP